MRWGKTTKDTSGWQWWFAWKPVRMMDGRWCWMEGVSRFDVSDILTSNGGRAPHHYRYRWWEDHVRARMEGTDNQQVAAQGPATSGPMIWKPGP